MNTTPAVTLFLVVLLPGCLFAAGCGGHPRPGAAEPEEDMPTMDLTAIESPILFAGDATTAYRDPAGIYHDGTFCLYVTEGKIDPLFH